MVAFNFKSEFAPKIQGRTKRSTIRKKQRCKLGDLMQLYTGQRTKNCKRIGQETCIGLAQVHIDEHCKVFLSAQKGTPFIDGFTELHEQEGFETQDDMIDFFIDHYGLPFTGWLHVWS